MLSTVATWAATQGLSLLLGFLATVIKNWMDGRQAAQGQRDLGAATTASAVNKESADAERRAAAVAPLTRDDAAGRLDAGTF
jgi:hypothetical protein